MEGDPEAAIAAAGQVLVAMKATPKPWEAVYTCFVVPAIRLEEGRGNHRGALAATLTYLVNGEPRFSHTWTPTP